MEIIFLIFVVLLPSIYQTLYAECRHTDCVTAEDWNRHSVWIKNNLAGNFNPLTTYLPTFHIFMMLPYYVLGSSIKYFQIVMALLTTLSLYILARKFHDNNMFIILIGILLSSTLYMLYNDVLTPQSLDLVLFSILVCFFFDRKYLISSVLLLAIIYSHGYGIAFYAIILVFSLLFRREYLRYLFIVSILMFPALFFQYTSIVEAAFRDPYLNADWGNFVLARNQLWTTNESIFYSFPIEHLLVFNGINILMLPVTVYLMRRLKKFSMIQAFYVIWFLCFIPMLFHNFTRAFAYMIIPLALYQASILSEYLNEKKTKR